MVTNKNLKIKLLKITYNEHKTILSFARGLSKIYFCVD